MRTKTVSGIMLSLLLIGMLILTFNIQRAEASEPPATEWARTYGGVGDDYAYAVVETGDGGYALAGDTTSFGAGQYDVWLVKVDSSGNVQWNKTYGGIGVEYANSVLETSDGGYALAGGTNSFGAGLWDVWLVKVDSSGNMQWKKTYGGADFDGARAVVETGDGGYALAGYTRSFGAGSSDFWLVKVDSSGNVQWNKTYGGGSYDFADSVVKTSDGGYALAGWTTSFGAGSSDFWLVKVDSSGNVQWNKTYGGGSYDDALSVVETGDGGYALAGYTGSFGAGGSDFWLVKVAGPPEYILTIYSSPTGATFTVDGVPRTTPWSGTYSEGSSVSLVMPETHDGYIWSHWLEDGDPNRIKTVTMDTNISLTAVYSVPKPVGGKAIPIDKPIVKTELQIPLIWLSTIILSMVATGIYLKKRKRNTEINS